MEERTIIIGSSNVVLENELGKVIDSFDNVVRFNRAPTEGFEQYVGSKTTTRFVNTHVSTNQPKDGEDLKFIPLLKNQIICGDTKKTDEDFYRVFDKSCRYIQVNRKANYEKFKTMFLPNTNIQIEEKEGREPSVGLNAICYYLNEGIKPTIYGFHLHDLNRKVSPHYWKEKKVVGSCHNFTHERKLINELVKNNFIDILQ